MHGRQVSTTSLKADLDGVGVLSNSPVIGADWLPALVHLLGVHTILGVEVLHLTVGEDAVDLHRTQQA